MPAWMTSLLRELTPVPMASSASTTTSRPVRANARATARPTTPAPMTRHSTASMVAFSASGRRRSTTRRRRRSDQHHAAVRHDDLSGDIVGVARRQERRDPREVVGLRRITEQDAGGEALDELALLLN